MNETEHEFHIQDGGDRIAIFSGGIGVYISWTISSNLIESDVKRFIERLDDRKEIKGLKDELTKYKTMNLYNRIFNWSNKNEQ